MNKEDSDKKEKFRKDCINWLRFTLVGIKTRKFIPIELEFKRKLSSLPNSESGVMEAVDTGIRTIILTYKEKPLKDEGIY